MIRKITLALSAVLLAGAMSGGTANAYPALPNLVNQDFTSCNNGQTCATKGSFSSVNPDGWTGGNGLIFIDGQNFANSAAGPTYLTTYGNPTGTVSGNYVEADGNPTFESGFNYTVTGLHVGQTYTLSFYQGASQQTGFGNGTPTTNQWIVSLGTAGLSVGGTGPTDKVYGPTETYWNTDTSASIATSPLMTVPSGGVVGWNYVSVNLTADSTTDLLSFLAWGDNGSTINLPPIAFLSGVDSPPGLGVVPEPAAWALMIVGLLGVGVAIRSRRARQPVEA